MYSSLFVSSRLTKFAVATDNRTANQARILDVPNDESNEALERGYRAFGGRRPSCLERLGR